jgi:hypothetical protein
VLVASVASVLAIALVITAGRASGPGTRDLNAALRHALLSYLLGAVILATVINLVAGLLR